MTVKMLCYSIIEIVSEVAVCIERLLLWQEQAVREAFEALVAKEATYHSLHHCVALPLAVDCLCGAQKYHLPLASTCKKIPPSS